MADSPSGEQRKRTRMVRPYPIHTLEDSLTVAGAIQRSNSGLPFDRALLARALNTTPASSSFTMRLNSSAKYGLTQGRYNDHSIAITPRGEATVAPKDAAERRRALREAALEPDVFRRFYEMLDGKPMPRAEYAQNLLQRELDIQPELSAECLQVAEANGLFAGILKRDSGDDLLVVLTQVDEIPAAAAAPTRTVPAFIGPPEPGVGSGEATGRVFIGSSGPDEATRYVTSVLDEFGVPYSTAAVKPGEGPGLTPEVSGEMRRCSAAVLVLEGNNEGAQAAVGQGVAAAVMYQLGAASVLYGRRMLIVRGEGVQLTPEIDTGLPSIVYQPDVPERAGMALLAALRRLGVIDVLPRPG